MKFDINKLVVDSVNWASNVRTRDWKMVKILSVSGWLPAYPIIYQDEAGSLNQVSVDGKFNVSTEIICDKDLVMVPEKRKVWVNIYLHNTIYSYNERERADDVATPDRIACIPIEFYEGEGLDEEEV